MWLAKVDVSFLFSGIVVIGAFGFFGALLARVGRFVRRLLDPTARYSGPMLRRPVVRLCPRSRCGFLNPGNARYCARCGQPLEPEKGTNSHG